MEIYKSNCLMIGQDDIVLASFSPFRSRHCNVETRFEIGFAITLRKLVYTYSNDTRTLIERIKKTFLKC
jgi:nucleoside 2-deoxyribosyltransferase